MTPPKSYRTAGILRALSGNYALKYLPVALLLCSASNTTFAADDDRLNDIEDAIERIEERIGSRSVAQGFDALELTIGGFLHSALTNVDTDDGSATSFNRQIFELLIRAKLDENWSAFIAQAFIRESDILYRGPEERTDPTFEIAVKSPTVIAWANYSSSNVLNFQFGRFITPHGIINIEHFPATLLDTEQPQFLRPFGGQTLFPNFVTGAQIHGQVFMGEEGANVIQYNLYSASYAGTDEEFIFGARTALSLGNTGVTLGLNASSGARQESNTRTFDTGTGLWVKTSNPGSDYTMAGADILIDKGALLWKNEIFKTSEDLGGNKKAYYSQPAFRISPQWTVFYRYDYLDNGAGTGDTIENMVGVNHSPRSNIRLRATITDKKFKAGVATQEADANIYQLSATLSF